MYVNPKILIFLILGIIIEVRGKKIHIKIHDFVD
jgi:hypothetical protein